MASIFQDSVAQALANQPWYIRRKDTLTAVAGTVLQAMNLLILVAGESNEWVNITIAVTIGIAQIIIHAGTKGAITPSMAKRLEQAGAAAHLDRVSLSSVGDVPLPIYDGLSTAEEGGRHRADD